MQATAPVAVFTWPSCDRKSAGPMKPICEGKDHLCAAPFWKTLIAMPAAFRQACSTWQTCITAIRQVILQAAAQIGAKQGSSAAKI